MVTIDGVPIQLHLRAEFARRTSLPECPVLYWILEDYQNWHDVVRGDGGCYSPDGPETCFSLPGETRKLFELRVLNALNSWHESQNASDGVSK